MTSPSYSYVTTGPLCHGHYMQVKTCSMNFAVMTRRHGAFSCRFSDSHESPNFSNLICYLLRNSVVFGWWEDEFPESAPLRLYFASPLLVALGLFSLVD